MIGKLSGNFIEDLLGNITTSWEFFKSCDKPVIVYGMGDGGDKVIDALGKIGVTVTDVIASDDFVRSQNFRGYTVKTLAQAEELYGDFVIALAFASSIPDVMQNIISISQRHKLIVPSVPVFGNNLFDRRFAMAHKYELNLAYDTLADDKSRTIYRNIITFLLTGELEPLMTATTCKAEVFDNILKLKQDENYLDLGAYRGDTIAEFLHYSGNGQAPKDNFNGNIIALEPDEKTYKKLCDYAGNFKNTHLVHSAVWSDERILCFANRSGRSSSLDFSPESMSGKPVPVTSVDLLTQKYNIIPSYIKADVEGAEYPMLCGAEKTIAMYKPKLNLAIYHRAEDIFKLILKVNELNKDYKIYIRHHPYIPFWDTNLYAI